MPQRILKILKARISTTCFNQALYLVLFVFVFFHKIWQQRRVYIKIYDRYIIYRLLLLLILFLFLFSFFFPNYVTFFLHESTIGRLKDFLWILVIALRGYCAPGPYFWRLCVFSQKNNANLDKISKGPDYECSKELKIHLFIPVETMVVKFV